MAHCLKIGSATLRFVPVTSRNPSDPILWPFWEINVALGRTISPPRQGLDLRSKVLLSSSLSGLTAFI